MDKHVDCTERKFGFCKVLWDIKNYCLTPDNPAKEFHSPEFYIRGFYLTKWKIILKRRFISKDRYINSFRLERLECGEYTETILVDCAFKYYDHFDQFIEDDMITHFGVKEANFSEQILFHCGINPVNTKHPCSFQFRLEILVQFPGIAEEVPPCKDIGIKRLSEDLFSLYEDGIMADIKLICANRKLQAHKVILFQRIPDEDFKIRRKTNNETMHIEDFNAEAAEKVIRFLYTGNLHYPIVEAEPSIAAYDFAQLLGIEPITRYYDPDALAITTEIEAEEYYATWTIEDFCNRDDYCLLSPVMSDKRKNTEWRLQVYPKGNKKKENSVFISLKFTTKVPKMLCVEIFLKSGPDEHNTYRFHRKIIDGGIVGHKNSVTLDNVINNYMMDDSLTVGFRLRLTTGEENTSIGNSVAGYKQSNEQKNYERFSEDIFHIYQTERFSDLHVNFAQHNIVFDIHECILHVRCVYLLHILKRKNHTYFIDISHAVIYEMFHFLYCGKLTGKISLEHTFSLYRTAAHFNFVSLKQVIEKSLTKTLSELNVKSMWEFALSENIENLISAARNFHQKMLKDRYL